MSFLHPSRRFAPKCSQFFLSNLVISHVPNNPICCVCGTWNFTRQRKCVACCTPLRRSAMMFHYVRFGIALAERCWTTFFLAKLHKTYTGKGVVISEGTSRNHSTACTKSHPFCLAPPGSWAKAWPFINGCILGCSPDDEDGRCGGAFYTHGLQTWRQET